LAECASGNGQTELAPTGAVASRADNNYSNGIAKLCIAYLNDSSFAQVSSNPRVQKHPRRRFRYSGERWTRFVTDLKMLTLSAVLPSLRCPPLRYGMAVLHSVLLSLALTPAWSAQSETITQVDATALVRRAVHHRLDAEKNHRPLRYTLHRVDEQHDTTKEIVETADGDVARLVAINGNPLSAEANRSELERLDTLANHPEIQEHRHKSEQKDAARVDRLLLMLPDALLFHYEGMAPCASGQCYHMSFTPNPQFTPPDMEADILRGMAGEVWIDREQERVTHLEAHCIAEVYFGYGILGKLDRGGTALLEDGNISGSDWELTRLQLHVTGKALMLKSLSFQITEDASHFSPVPPGLSYRDAIQVLKQSGP